MELSPDNAYLINNENDYNCKEYSWWYVNYILMELISYGGMCLFISKSSL